MHKNITFKTCNMRLINTIQQSTKYILEKNNLYLMDVEFYRKNYSFRKNLLNIFFILK